MIATNIIIIFCLSLMALGIVKTVYNLIIKNRPDRIDYVRNFKKGNAALVYLFSIPLFYVGIQYAGHRDVYGFFLALKQTISMLALKYEVEAVEALMNANRFYRFAVYFSFGIVTLNVSFFLWSFVAQYVWDYALKIKFDASSKDKLIIFGNNESNCLIYKSEKNREKVLVDKMNKESMLDLYKQDIHYNSIELFDPYISKSIDACIAKNKEYVFVINTGNEEKNLKLGKSFIEKLRSLDEEKRRTCFGKVKVFLFGDPQYEAIYEDVIDEGFGCISYVNKYQKIAMDFIDRYPLTHFMNEEQIDYNTSLIKKGVAINVFMIGFGKTNQQIFLTSVANNQFITKSKTGVKLKRVNYHIFDKCPAENNKNLNHNYYRYRNECAKAKKADYLPLPSYPAKEKYYHLDINAPEYYDKIKETMRSSDKSVNFFIIAFGTDLENVDMGKKIAEKVEEWGVKNATIFVKVRKQSIDYRENDKYYLIADEFSSVYDIDSIVEDQFLKMAKLHDEVYSIERKIKESDTPERQLTEKEIKEIKEEANYNWYAQLSQKERDSNLFCCLSLRIKLNLMGLDYCFRDGKVKELPEEEYLKIYAGADLPNTDYYKVQADGKKIIRYPLDFMDSRRRDLAILEHLRWNSFMISKGMIPATIEQIKEEQILKDGKLKFTNGKNYRLRRHGNLTTFDGLIEFRRIVSARDHQSELSKDVIKYDYQALDDAYWFLQKAGYIIYKIK